MDQTAALLDVMAGWIREHWLVFVIPATLLVKWVIYSEVRAAVHDGTLEALRDAGIDRLENERLHRLEMTHLEYGSTSPTKKHA